MAGSVPVSGLRAAVHGGAEKKRRRPAGGHGRQHEKAGGRQGTDQGGGHLQGIPLRAVHFRKPRPSERGLRPSDEPREQHLGAGSRGGQGASEKGVRRPGHPAQLLRRRESGAGRADHRAGGGRRRAGGVHHRAPFEPRHAEGCGGASQGALPQLLRRSGLFQHPYLLRTDLRGKVHHRRHRRRHGAEQPHRLHRLLPDFRRPCLHQRLCPGGADDQSPGAD